VGPGDATFTRSPCRGGPECDGWAASDVRSLLLAAGRTTIPEENNRGARRALASPAGEAGVGGRAELDFGRAGIRRQIAATARDGGPAGEVRRTLARGTHWGPGSRSATISPPGKLFRTAGLVSRRRCPPRAEVPATLARGPAGAPLCSPRPAPVTLAKVEDFQPEGRADFRGPGRRDARRIARSIQGRHAWFAIDREGRTSSAIVHVAPRSGAGRDFKARARAEHMISAAPSSFAREGRRGSGRAPGRPEGSRAGSPAETAPVTPAPHPQGVQTYRLSIGRPPPCLVARFLGVGEQEAHAAA